MTGDVHPQIDLVCADCRRFSFGERWEMRHHWVTCEGCLRAHRLSALSFGLISGGLSFFAIPAAFLLSFEVFYVLTLLVVYSTVTEVLHALISPVKCRSPKARPAA